MNSKDYRNIREAYLQVYVPQELTEEQVWEGVEEWVNALLQEGYDLSDYTWEEMYESYLSEVANTQTPQQRAEFQKKVNTANEREIGNIKKVGGDALNVAGKLLNPVGALAGAGLKRAGNELNYVKKSGLASYDPTIQKPAAKTTTPNISAERPKSKFAGARDAAIEKAKQIKGSPVLGPKIVGPKIVGPGSAGGSSSGSGGSGGSTPKPTAITTPTAPKPAASTTPKFDVDKTGIKPPTTFTKPAAATPEPTPSAEPSGETDRLKKALDIKKSDVTSSFDMFDVVKGYLIGEGYADTEEAAVAIMGNMSNAWVRSIIG